MARVRYMQQLNAGLRYDDFELKQLQTTMRQLTELHTVGPCATVRQTMEPNDF